MITRKQALELRHLANAIADAMYDLGEAKEKHGPVRKLVIDIGRHRLRFAELIEELTEKR